MLSPASGAVAPRRNLSGISRRFVNNSNILDRIFYIENMSVLFDSRPAVC